MRFHPIFTSAWIFLAFVFQPAFGMDDYGVNEGTSSSCQPANNSPTYQQALSMTDKDVDSQCTLEKGAELDLCKTVLNHMRDSARAAEEARLEACQKLYVRPPSRPIEGQTEAFSDSSQKAKLARDGNLSQAKIYGASLEDMHEHKDQMKRSTESLISEQHALGEVDTETKVNTSVISSESRMPASRAATIPEPSYDDYQVGRHITSPRPQPSVIDASTNGSRNLAEYEQKLPYRIQQQKRMLKMMDDFEEETKAKKTYHESTALELGKQAATLMLQAKKLGAASDSLDMPLQSGPKASGTEKAPTTAAAAAASSAKLGKAEVAGVDAKDSARASLTLSLSEKTNGTSEDAAVLDTFQSRLLEDGKGKLSGPERSRLKELLRRRSVSRAGGVGGVMPGELVAEMLEEAAREEARAPASAVGRANDRRGIVRLDVDGAIKEIESQLEEMDRSMGILSVDSESLFERVRSVHRRSEKSGSVGQES